MASDAVSASSSRAVERFVLSSGSLLASSSSGRAILTGLPKRHLLTPCPHDDDCRYVPSPVCAPSRAALSAGREYDDAGVGFNGDGDFPVRGRDGAAAYGGRAFATYYQTLRAAGYWTMTAGKDDLTKPSILGYHKVGGGLVRCDGGEAHAVCDRLVILS